MLVTSPMSEGDTGHQQTDERLMVSVLVCTFNREHLLGGALRSLLAQTGMAQEAYEIIVVDDGSTDGTQHVISNLQRNSPIPIVSVIGTHSGLGAARNLAASHARGEWLAFFDDDQIAAPSWLAALVATVSKSPVDGAGGRIELRFLDPVPQQVSRTVRLLLGEKREAKVRRVRWRRDAGLASTIPGTGNALVRSALFARLGGFRSGLNFGEDAEFFRRAARAGARFAYSDDAWIEHLVPPARMQLSYLLSVARKGGAFTPARDLEDFGAPAVASECLLRIGHALGIKLPALLYAALTGNHGTMLGNACSITYSLRYCITGMRLIGLRAIGFCRAEHKLAEPPS